MRQISLYFFFAPAQTLCRLVLCVRQSPLQVYKNILMDFPSSIYRSAYLGRHKHGVFFFHSPPTVWIKPRPDFSASEWVDLFQQPEAPAHLRDWAQTGGGWALCVLESQQSLWMYLQTFFTITNFIVSSYSLNFIFLKTQIMQEELLSCGNWCSKIWCSSVLGSCSFFRNVDEVWGAQEVNELKSLYIIVSVESQWQ